MEKRPSALRMKDVLVHNDEYNESKCSSLHRVSCVSKKCQRTKHHMGEVVHMMTRLHSQIQNLRGLFLGVVSDIEDKDRNYYQKETYAEITHRLKCAHDSRERARIKVDARRQRIRSRRECMRLKRSHDGHHLDRERAWKLPQLHLHDVDVHPPLPSSPASKLFRCGKEDCMLEYEMPTTPTNIHSQEGYLDPRYDEPQPNINSSPFQTMSRLGFDQTHEETSVWGTLVNELTKEWKNSGTPVVVMRHAKVHTCQKDRREIHSDTQQVTLSDLSKITSDISTHMVQFSNSDIVGPLHSTMNDFDFSPIKETEEKPEPRYQGSCNSLHTASSCSSLDPKDVASEAWYTREGDDVYEQFNGPSMNVDKTNSIKQNESEQDLADNCGERHETPGNSFSQKVKCPNNTNIQFSLEAACDSLPDLVNLTEMETYNSQSDSRERATHSTVGSSYKESDGISDSSINESDLEALQPRFKKPIGRPKRVHRSRGYMMDCSANSQSTEDRGSFYAPLNTPNASGSSKPQSSSDIIINKIKSNDNLQATSENSVNTSENYSMLNHTRPDCIGKYTTPGYQPLPVHQRLTYYSDNDSGIGVRPPCVGCSATPMNIQGQLISYDSDDDSASDSDNENEENLNFYPGSPLGSRPDCLGKSMREIKQLVGTHANNARNSIDTDSGVSMCAGSPVNPAPIHDHPVTRHPKSRYARLRMGCMSSETDQSAVFTEEIEVLETQIVHKGNKKSIVRRLRNLGQLFGRSRRSSVR